MEFQYIHQTQAHGQRCTDPDGELPGFGDGDDSFMEEITRQILLLMADEDDDEAIPEHKRNLGFSSTGKRGSDGLVSRSFPAKLQPGSYFYWCDGEDRDLVPAWMLSLWRKGNGTGVFIPETKSRRRYKHGRINNGKRREYYRNVESN